MLKAVLCAVLLLGSFCDRASAQTAEAAAVTAPQRKLTVADVTEAAAAIESVKSLKEQLDQIDKLPVQIHALVNLERRCGGCCSAYSCASQGYGDYQPFDIPRQVLHDQVQRQIDECIKKLNEMGIKP